MMWLVMLGVSMVRVTDGSYLSMKFRHCAVSFESFPDVAHVLKIT